MARVKKSAAAKDIMKKALLSGNEAIARGAFEAGIQVAAGYPGTPSSEILENVAKYKTIYAEWSVNEKVAMDVAAGAAYSGRRAMVTTKQVGMNVLSDSLFYTVYTGLEAGLVVVTADDPGITLIALSTIRRSVISTLAGSPALIRLMLEPISFRLANASYSCRSVLCLSTIDPAHCNSFSNDYITICEIRH